MPINGIADKVGFTNSNYFFTLFKKLHGVTPSEYRQLEANDSIREGSASHVSV